MWRREFIAMLGAATAWPLPAPAQQAGKVYRIGFLWESPAAYGAGIEAFRRALRDLGWVEGRNIAIEYRWAEGKPERAREMAEELVRLKVDIIVAPTSIYVEAAKGATSTIPIIFTSHADPVGTGHVTSLARPGGQITGLATMLPEITAKGLELLKEAVPSLARVAVIWDPATPAHKPGLNAVEAAGQALDLRLQTLAVRSVAEFDTAFSTMAREGADGVLVLTTPLYTAGERRLAELAITHKLPSVFGARQFVVAGGLLSFGPDRADVFRRGATYVDKILKGAKPADLPVEQPTKFELVVNLKTARVLGLTIPHSFLLRADEVIE